LFEKDLFRSLVDPQQTNPLICQVDERNILLDQGLFNVFAGGGNVPLTPGGFDVTARCRLGDWRA
jgi:hypothetical protein